VKLKWDSDIMRFKLRSMMALVALAALLTVGGVLLVRHGSEAAHLHQCRMNLQQLALGLISYGSVHGSFPAGTAPNARLRPEKRLSWLVVAWRFIERWGWLFSMTEAWDSEANRITRGQGVGGGPRAMGRVAGLCCPAAAGSSEDHMPGWTWYVGIAGVGTDAPTLPEGHPRAGIFGYDRQTPLGAIKDGASNTLAIAETGLDNGPWTAGGEATVRGLDPSRLPYIGEGRQFGGLHRDGVMVAMADGSVRFLRETMEPRVFGALATVAGGELLPEGWQR
jgi:prepilin-type processing-associated H-X9-DG protein